MATRNPSNNVPGSRRKKRRRLTPFGKFVFSLLALSLCALCVWGVSRLISHFSPEDGSSENSLPADPSSAASLPSGGETAGTESMTDPAETLPPTESAPEASDPQEPSSSDPLPTEPEQPTEPQPTEPLPPTEPQPTELQPTEPPTDPFVVDPTLPPETQPLPVGPDPVQYEEHSYPILSIYTAGGAEIASKYEYVACSVNLFDNEGVFSLEEVSARIRGRGNSSWKLDKKPYRLQFDEKINFLGTGKAKAWALIPNYNDHSHLRNHLAYECALAIGLEMTSNSSYVELYLNGNYAGLYLACEQVQQGTNRVHISDDLADVDTGYLIELDARAYQEGEYNEAYFAIDDGYYVIKSPDVEDAAWTRAHFQYIRELTTAAWNSLFSGSWDEICARIEPESFADTYIIHELFHMVDVDFASFFLYRDAGGKLCSGPVWDFDSSSGNCSYQPDCNDPEQLWAAHNNRWYRQLLEYPQFREIVAVRLEAAAPLLSEAVLRSCAEARSHQPAFEKDAAKWNTLGRSVWQNPSRLARLSTWGEHVDYLQNWLSRSLAFLQSQYSR